MTFRFAVLIAVLMATAAARATAPPDGPFAAAERWYAEGSYQRAHDAYAAIDLEDLPADGRRWVEFRLPDSKWRALSATTTRDQTELERARKALAKLAEAPEREADRDLVYAEANESLGDFHWMSQFHHNWHGGWNHYSRALDWWAGRSEIATVRTRYLDIVWRMAEPSWRSWHQRFYGQVPVDILQNALEIAVDPNDVAHAHCLIAMNLGDRGGFYRSKHVIRHFEAALAPGPSAPWHEMALFHFARYMEHHGDTLVVAPGQWQEKPDFVRALRLYRQFVETYPKGRSRHHDDAQNAINNITQRTVSVTVAGFFRPGMSVSYDLNWRNVEEITLELHRVDLVDAVQYPRESKQLQSWLNSIKLDGANPVKSWKHLTGDTGEHFPGHAAERVDPALEPGCYVLTATSGTVSARDLVLVTDLAVVVKSLNNELVAFACDAIGGAPAPETEVVLWAHVRVDRSRWRSARMTGVTDVDGICRFDLDQAGWPRHWSNRSYFLAAGRGTGQAFANAGIPAFMRASDEWRLYAYTDRPAYRPEDTVKWKVTSRQYDGSRYHTPEGTELTYTIHDPRGAEVAKGTLPLNAFGSAWDEPALSKTMPLGNYEVRFKVKDQGQIGSATLFRLEEYKRPEFTVSVTTPTDDDGTAKTYRIGETVSAAINAEYYFGGPVANATVNVVVRQVPFHFRWPDDREYPWIYEQDHSRWRGWGWNQQVIREETITTDENGQAIVTFDTPDDLNNDYEYVIEARVTDASRREITGSGTVRATRHRYFTRLKTEHNIHRPGSRVTVSITARDANGTAIADEGSVAITRRKWVEIYMTPEGRKITIDPVITPDRGGIRPDWHLGYQGYIDEPISTHTITTDADGNAELVFMPDKPGYYRVRWLSDAESLWPVTAETHVWVASRNTEHVAYRSGEIEIIVDKETFAPGAVAPIMLTTASTGRTVLLTVEGDDLYELRVIRMTGTTKLVELKLDERLVPNAYISAITVHEAAMHRDVEEIVIPPLEHFLTIDITPDRAEYAPRDEGQFTITTRDHRGQPVASEIALAVYDESVTYIQADQAGDPRQRFFDRRQGGRVGTASLFDIRPFRRPADEAQALTQERWFAGEELASVEMEGAMMDRDGVAFARGQAGLGGGRPRRSSMAPAGAAADDSFAMAKSARKETAAFAPPAPPAEGADGPENAPVQVRHDFRATAFWSPNIATDDRGIATVKVSFPDSLTAWYATARVVTMGDRFGIGEATTRTRLPLIVRLQAPRFFTVGDEVVVSAVINNNTNEPMQVKPALDAEGLRVLGAIIDGKPVSRLPETVTVDAGRETRVDWRVAVESAGEARLQVTGRAGVYADAMERSYPVHEHGIERMLATAGKVRGDDVTITVSLPSARRAGSTSLAVQVTPSMAVTMLDALPYLVDYPYGCTEQTMSRFLPAVIVAKALEDMGLDPEDAMSRVFGGIEAEHAAATHPKGKRSLDELDEIVTRSLQRLYDFQHADGGWGWWKDGSSDHFMTAYVVWGLALARDAGVEIRDDVLTRGADYIDLEIIEAEKRPELAAWMLHAASAAHDSLGNRYGEHSRRALGTLWKNRDRLNAYGKSLLALAAHRFGETSKAQTLVRNLENGVKRDDAPDTSVIVRGGGPQHHAATMGTAHWGADGVWRRWSSGPVETTSFALQALVTIDPGHELVEPVTNWLVRNRRGSQWSNTRDTAITILGLTQYLHASGELSQDVAFDLVVNGQVVASEQRPANEALAAPSRFEIDPSLLHDGDNEVRIVRRGGAGAIYFATDARFFSLEEPIPAGGNEIFVRRDYYRLVGEPTLLKGMAYERQLIGDGDSVASGDRIEVILTVESKNDYEYLVFEDLKPAGIESVEVRSGGAIYARELNVRELERRFDGDDAPGGSATTGGPDHADYTGASRWIHRELRDRAVALFLDRLPQGTWEIRYTMRAEVPGEFHALPVLGHAMYVPEIKANSAEMRLRVYE